MRLRSLLPIAFLGSVFAAPIADSWPFGPLVANGRWIQNAKGQNVTYVGVNWSGHGEAMIPEGLQYQSISKILSDIKSLGLNVIRLTFAIQMIDEIYAKGGADIPLSTAFTQALGATNGTKILNQILAKNPQFTASTTRLQVFDAVAAEALKQEIYVHLDNHISKAIWCCGETDGNAWFGDTYFNAANWQRGLKYMANHGKAWPALTSIGLRNEPRNPSNNAAVAKTYNWETWYKNMIPAGAGVNEANPHVLIFYSGMNYDTTLAPIPTAADLGGGLKFRKTDFKYANKMVLELHNYQTSATSCNSITSGLYNGGYNALDASNKAVVNVMPVVMTEWGHDQSNAEYKGVYHTCLQSYLGGLKAGWMLWVISGSYYVRSGTQDYDETWALYNHNWSGWRQQAAATAIKSMAASTMA